MEGTTKVVPSVFLALREPRELAFEEPRTCSNPSGPSTPEIGCNANIEVLQVMSFVSRGARGGRGAQPSHLWFPASPASPASSARNKYGAIGASRAWR